MKKLTIVPDDNMVVVDGDGILIDVTADPNIHAIQWDDVEKKGTIEYKDGSPNSDIGAEEIVEFLPLVSSHGNEKARIANIRAEEEAAISNHEALPSTKRLRDFQKEMKMSDQLDEILKYIDSKGDGTPGVKAMINKSKEIKDRFPKEGE